jgi:hypothetical protein
MLPPLYIADRGSPAINFVKVDRAACHHVALLTPETLLRAGLPGRKGSRPQRAAAVQRVRPEGAGSGFGEVAGQGARGSLGGR